jgi:hypothetical protein
MSWHFGFEGLPCIVAMAFGWSAGDIFNAIKFMVDVAKALDEVDGAPKKFREASSFLTNLNSTLRPLQTFTALDTKPAYKKDVEAQVEAIKGPVERFIGEVKGLQDTIGVPKEGHFRRFQNIPSKLKWHFFTADKALALQEVVEHHLMIIHTLMQRLTL